MRSMPAFIFLSISDRIPVSKMGFDAGLVVVSDVFVQFCLKVFNRLEILEIEQFRLEENEEVLHHRAVQTVALP